MRSGEDLRWLAALSLARLGETAAALAVLQAKPESESSTGMRFDPRSVLIRMLGGAGQK
ncbi:MAG: hypothetical protein AB1651_13110 [Pseudomonadota bacterium]